MLRHPVTLPPRPLPPPPLATQTVVAPVATNAFQSFGFLMLCLYLVTPFLNDIFGHFFGFVPRLTLIPLGLLVLCTAFSGTVGRALQAPLGRWWLGLFVLMLVSTLFSFWPGGSVALLEDFVPKRYIVLFCVCAVQITVLQCVRFAYVNILPATLILFLCFKYGTVSNTDGRFLIDQSLFFDNSNDLAIGLIMAASGLLFVFFARGFLLKIIAAAEITLCLLYILKTGSRGTFLAALTAALFAMLFAKKRLLVMLLVPGILAALITFVPAKTIQRLMTIVSDPEQEVAAGNAGGDVESQLQREDLVKLSLKITSQHPLLGVGPGMFDNFVQQSAKQTGKHMVSLNTHNAYTEISSECGIPAFICYLATIVLTIKYNYRMYRAFSKDPQKFDGRLAGIAFSGLIGGIAYAVASIFHHIGYGVDLSWLGGETLALWLATQPLRSGVASVARRV